MNQLATICQPEPHPMQPLPAPWLLDGFTLTVFARTTYSTGNDDTNCGNVKKEFKEATRCKWHVAKVKSASTIHSVPL